MRACIFILVFLSLGCGRFKRNHTEQPETNPAIERNRLKAELYLEHGAEAKGPNGYVHGKCDGLLFNSLYVVAGGTADIMASQGEPGQWFRSPEHDCYGGAPGEAGSDISQDMFVGLFTWAWHTKQLKVISDVLQYGKDHNWVMGRGDPFRTILRPGMIALAYNIKRELGGDADAVVDDASRQPDPSLKLNPLVPTGFEAHLQVVSELVRSHVLGGASDISIAVFKAQAERQPRNALFNAAYHLYTDGDQTQAENALDNGALFPSNRLPTNADRCEEYLYQRDDLPKDWAGCTDDTPRLTHSGTDLLFTLMIVDNKLRRN